MDSGNSGSMQSSSGGDEEYDSSLAFFNSSISTPPPPQPPPPPPPPSNNSLPPPLFSSQSQPNFFPTFTHPSTQNSLLNLDMLWPKTLASQQPNCTTDHQLLSPLGTKSPPPPQTPLSQTRPSSSSPDQTRVSKKRSRASRRAPTTVLTTDTSNFRAMVQEFTGIPAPPFSARTRLDLFNPRPSPPYLLRPFPQKVQIQPPTFGIASSSTNIATVVNSSYPNSTSNNNYQLLSELGLTKQSQQNPILTFQSLLQSANHSPKYPLANTPGFNAKAQGLSTSASNPTMGLLQDFNMNHQGNGTAHPREFSNLGEMMQMSGSNWEDQGHLRSFNENYNGSQQVNPCKVNPLSDFHGEKGPMENVPSRGGEGIVDSWICSSD